MSSGETFTALDVDERRELLELVREVVPGDAVRLTWASARARDGSVSVEGRARDPDRLSGRKADHVELYLATDERKGSIYVEVREDHLENLYYSPIVAYSTGGAFTSRQPRLGELLDVEVLDEEGSA